MPVFHSGPNEAPAWCELEQFDIVRLDPGQSHNFERVARRELIVVTEGDCRISTGDSIVFGRQATIAELPSEAGRFEVIRTLRPTTLVRLGGRWEDTYGGAGLFMVGEGDNRTRKGDPVDYPKTTAFDNHYHDLDEFWIFYEGRGVAYSENTRYEVAPGDCLATGMGFHHDVAETHTPVLRGVWFETTPRRQGRRGHLSEHTHGPAEPDTSRQ